MTVNAVAISAEVRARLIEVGGQTSHDLGLGRIFGQILTHLYLTDGKCSLDDIGEDLGLSKAAVSIAARQLESLGLLRRVWIKGDRKSYYRTADDIASAVQQGLLAFVRQKVNAVAAELDVAATLLSEDDAIEDVKFLESRVRRAQQLGKRATRLMDSRLLRLFIRS